MVNGIHHFLGIGRRLRPECGPLCEHCSAFVTDHHHCNAASIKPVLHWSHLVFLHQFSPPFPTATETRLFSDFGHPESGVHPSHLDRHGPVKMTARMLHVTQTLPSATDREERTKPRCSRQASILNGPQKRYVCKNNYRKTE